MLVVNLEHENILIFGRICLLGISLYLRNSHIFSPCLGLKMGASHLWEIGWMILGVGLGFGMGLWTPSLKIQLHDLEAILVEIRPSISDKDKWNWKLKRSTTFSVKSCYLALMSNVRLAEVNNITLRELHFLWKNVVPSKTHIFDWWFLHFRLLTRDESIKCGSIIENYSYTCVLCFHDNETIEHLFFIRKFDVYVWQDVATWFGVFLEHVVHCTTPFFSFSKLTSRNGKTKICNLIWLASSWCI